MLLLNLKTPPMKTFKSNQIIILAIAILVLAISNYLNSGNGRYVNYGQNGGVVVLDTKTAATYSWMGSAGWMRLRPEINNLEEIKNYKFNK